MALKSLVFLAGAVLMGLEIAGSRVLAPHFGNSIFVWGSLISVFLAALSVGYYLGGRLADQRPSHVLLSAICIAISAWIIGLSFFAGPVCHFLVSQGLGEESGPLIAALILFLPPSAGMGIVSPFAIRLATASVGSVGQVAGSLYALSTVGSIAGTMLTTFVLIPHVGLSWILRGLGATLLLCSLATIAVYGRPRTPAAAAAVSAALLLSLFMPPPSEHAWQLGQHVRLDVGTPYHNIAVVDNELHGTRELRFDRYTESAISLDPPHESVAGYTNYFHLAFLLNPQIERALFIGAGGGVGPRSFAMHRPEMKIDVVDIDAKVLEIARTHFFLEDRPGLTLAAADGRMFVRGATAQYDCIVLDAFTIGGRIPFHLVTQEYFALCRERMTERGVFVMNINSSLTGQHAEIFRSVCRTLQNVFPQVAAFAKERADYGDDQSTNILFVASNESTPLSPAEWQARAEAYESDSYIKRDRLREMVRDLVSPLPDVSTAPLFTDDYAPIETMTF